MRIPFNGNYKITQAFGINPQDYASYGLKGHDGIDYGLPTGTPVLSPISGVVKEASFDAKGYGNYVKIENDGEGSTLAHLETIGVSVGFNVKEGDIIGTSDNTGNSTGPHLHWGYYRIPRDRSNGYDGYIDQTPYLTGGAVVYMYKYKVGDTIEPSVDIPVGLTAGTESMDYGHVGFKFPAKIIGMSSGYYNIDQTEIGGGTGWVNASKVDEVPAFIPQSVIPPASPEVAYTLDAYKKLEGERNDALASAQSLNDQLVQTNNKLSTFAALGYNGVEDVTNSLNAKDETIIGLNKQMQQILDRNQKLLETLKDKENEDSTAIDVGLKAAQDVKELRRQLVEVAKNMGAKPEIHSMMEKVFDLKSIAEKFLKAKEVQQAESKIEQKVVSKVSGLDSLMSFLGLGKGGANS